MKYHLIAPCYFGTESTAAFEVRRIGAEDVQVTDGRIAFTGGPEIMGPAVPRDKGKWIAGMPAWVIKRSIKSRIRGMQVGRQLTRARIESITEIAFLDGALRYYWRRR